MGLIIMPTNVRLPTLLDDLRDEYLSGRIDANEFERGVGALLESGTADDVAPYHGLHTVGEWR